MEAVLITLCVCGMIVFVVWLVVDSDNQRKHPYDDSIDDVEERIRASGGDPDEVMARIKKLLWRVSTNMIIVRIKKTDAHTGVKKNEVYAATSYTLDPAEKVTLLRRLPDMHEPQCNQYWNNVVVLGDFKPRDGWEKV